jgi:O-antigen ligase
MIRPVQSTQPQPFPAAAPAASGWRSRFTHWLNFGWVDPARASADFVYQHEKDSGGDFRHAALGALWGFLIVGPITPAEIALAFPGIAWLIRLFIVPRAARWAFLQPATFILVAFLLWQIIACSWSHVAYPAFEQVAFARYALPVLVLYPIMPWRRFVIGGMVLGFLAGNASQLINWIGVRWDVPLLAFKHFTDRNGGWWPINTGAQHLVAALGFNLPVALMGKGKWRAFGVVASLASIAGLIATGSRGSWIAACFLVVVIFTMAIAVIPDRRRRLRFAGGALAASACVAAVLWITAGAAIRSRFGQAVDEVSRAVEHRDFQRADGSRVGDDSARVAMLVWAVEAIREKPLLGVGTGNFLHYVETTQQADGKVYKDFVQRRVKHCHNAVLHVWATLGAVGLTIALVVVFIVLWGAFAPLTRESLGTYAAGPAFALVGVLAHWPFDAIIANATTAKLLFALIALCPAWYPRSLKEARAHARATEGSP